MIIAFSFSMASSVTAIPSSRDPVIGPSATQNMPLPMDSAQLDAGPWVRNGPLYSSSAPLL